MKTVYKSYKTLEEVLEQADQHEAAVGFVVAPVTSVKGGRPSWRCVSEDGKEWVLEDVRNSFVPQVDDGTEKLPPLPPSPLGKWLFAFVDKDGDTMRPYYLIEQQPERRSGASNVIDVESIPAGPAPPPASASPNGTDIHQLSLQIITDSYKFALDAMREGRLTITTMRQQMDALMELGHKERQRLVVQLHEAEATRDKALGANAELSVTVAELKNADQFWITLQELFRDKPELLMAGLKDIGVTLLEKLKSS